MINKEIEDTDKKKATFSSDWWESRSAFVRSYKKQLRISHNSKDSKAVRRKRIFWLCLFYLKAIRRGWLSMFSESLGSEVIYKGRKLFISNWAGSPSPTLSGKGFYQQNIPRSEIKSVHSLKEFRHRFKSGLGWYLNSWIDIDINKKLN